MNTEVDDIVRQYKERSASVGAINPVIHDHLKGHRELKQAHGRISACAELWRNVKAMVPAVRYSDRYKQINNRGKFHDCKLSFLSYVPAHQYTDAFG
jgi:hypothetical protein